MVVEPSLRGSEVRVAELVHHRESRWSRKEMHKRGKCGRCRGSLTSDISRGRDCKLGTETKDVRVPA